MPKKPQFSYALMLHLQQYACFYCSKKLDPVGFCAKTAKHGYTRDHFFPRSMGNTLQGNMVLACSKCNKKKDNHLPTREEIFRFLTIWSHIKDGHSLDLEEFILAQSIINSLEKLVGPPVDTRHII